MEALFISMIKIKLLRQLEEITKHEKVTGKKYSITDEFESRVSEFPSQYAFTMISVPKVGINPKTSYNTPAGVYCYPLDYQHFMQLMNNKLPFVSRAPYIGLIKLNLSDPSKWLFLDKNNPGTYEDATEAIDYLNLLGMDGEALYKRAARAGKHWRMGHSARIWDMLFFASEPPSGGLSKNYRTVKWNKLFRNLGYIGAYDNGNGIIHQSEPTQLVCFEPSAYETIGVYETAILRKQTLQVLSRGDAKKQQNMAKSQLRAFWKSFAELPPEDKIIYGDLDIQQVVRDTQNIHVLDGSTVKEKDGVKPYVRAIYALPDNFTVEGSLSLVCLGDDKCEYNNVYAEELVLQGSALPEGIKFKNFVLLNMGESFKFPEGFSVEGNLSFENQVVDSLPENIKVGGTLTIGGGPIYNPKDFFPKNFDIKFYKGYIGNKLYETDDLKGVLERRYPDRKKSSETETSPEKKEDFLKQPDLEDFDF